MQDDRPKDAEDLFFEALEFAAEERAAFLDDACGDDVALRAEVWALLDADHGAESFLARPAWDLTPVPSGDEGTPADPGLPVERLGEFRLVRLLGAGGMGVVYEAVQESLGRRVALKVLRPEQVGSPEAQSRFWREVEAVAELRHPGVVTVLGGGEDKGICWFAMELVEGRGLDEVLREEAGPEGRLDTERILRWILEVAGGLEHAHAAGIIHRDVKPSNIHITSEDRAMLMDFGIARHEARASLTLTGEFRGTPHYASPEQVRARKAGTDARTDVYSLGVTLYEAVTGRVPFEGDNTTQVFRMILEAHPPAPRGLRPSLSRDLDTVITKAMEKEAKHRYQSMEAFADDLRRLLEGEPVAARPPGWARRSVRWVRRNRAVSVGALAMLLLVVGLAIAHVVTSRQERLTVERTERMFLPVMPALGFPPDVVWAIAWGWGLGVDPGDPGCHMLHALSAFESGELQEARVALEECIAACGPRDEAHLEGEAHRLLVLVSLGLAHETVGPEAEEHLASAAAARREAERFDFSIDRTLIWLGPTERPLKPAPAAELFHELEINPNHHLVHFFIGMAIFGGLHRGGELEIIEEAITHFEEVLRVRQDHLATLVFLGRTYYFLARSHGFPELAGAAVDYLQRAENVSGELPYHMILNTRGSICLLLGELEEAVRWNERALALIPRQDRQHAHNIWTGIGSAQAELGRLEEAWDTYVKAYEKVPNDGSLNLAMAELSLRTGRTEDLWEFAADAADSVGVTSTGGLTAAHVVQACYRLQQDELKSGAQLLLGTYHATVFSAQDLGRAAVLLATLPEELRNEINYRGKSFEDQFARLASRVYRSATFEGRQPAIAHSALGAENWCRGRYTTAIGHLRDALDARKEWPESARSFWWTEDARDHYFLAMAYQDLSEGDPALVERAREYFDSAETAYRSRKDSTPIRDLDVFTRVRARAREVMGEDD